MAEIEHTLEKAYLDLVTGNVGEGVNGEPGTQASERELTEAVA